MAKSPPSPLNFLQCRENFQICKFKVLRVEQQLMAKIPEIWKSTRCPASNSQRLANQASRAEQFRPIGTTPAKPSKMLGANRLAARTSSTPAEMLGSPTTAMAAATAWTAPCDWLLRTQNGKFGRTATAEPLAAEKKWNLILQVGPRFLAESS
jgi:hypothetical protein